MVMKVSSSNSTNQPDSKGPQSMALLARHRVSCQGAGSGAWLSLDSNGVRNPEGLVAGQVDPYSYAVELVASQRFID